MNLWIIIENFNFLKSNILLLDFLSDGKGHVGQTKF